MHGKRSGGKERVHRLSSKGIKDKRGREEKETRIFRSRKGQGDKTAESFYKSLPAGKAVQEVRTERETRYDERKTAAQNRERGNGVGERSKTAQQRRDIPIKKEP